MNREIFIKILTFLTTIGLAVSGWFFNETFQRMNTMEQDIGELQIYAVKDEASKFSSSDFIKAKEIIDAQIVSTDKRVLIMEESNKAIKEHLLEIKEVLREIKANQKM